MFDWQKDHLEADEMLISQQFLTKAERRRLKETKELAATEAYKKENNNRLVYPVDLWFLISQHVEPEQVKCFSMICRGTLYVTSTKQFWLDLYRRFVFNLSDSYFTKGFAKGTSLP